jgi:LmbE family N-acetylglucosaminyl deacetylase
MTPTVTHAWLTAGSTPGLRPAAPPAGKRIAVIAPHPDDELLGCGGTLVRAREAHPDTRIGVLYLTDGERGSPEAAAPLELARIRRDEARRGLAVLGLDQGEHASFPDGALTAGPREIARVLQFLEASSPEVVMVPAPLDPHPDHRTATRILARVLEMHDAIAPSVWLYEIQPCFPMNALVRIDGVETIKARALAAHASQDVDRLTQAAQGLAACRALYAPATWKYAEAFRIGSASNFVALCRSLGCAGAA